MGLLDQVIGGLMGGAGSGGSPLQGVLMSLLGGQQGAAGGQASGGQAYGQGTPNQGAGGAAGGLGGLLAAFQQAGLGQIAQSWISNGPNQPVSPQQLQSALGQGQVQSMANQAGMAPQDFLTQLSQHLPQAVDGVTPHGRLPDEGTMSV